MPTHSTRKAEILAVHQKHAELSINRLTQICWEEGVWPLEERESMAFAAAKRQCADALKSKDAVGLPVATPTARTSPTGRIWMQLSLWEYDDGCYYLGTLLRQTEKDIAAIELIRTYLTERFGQSPPIPQWTFPEEAPVWWVEQLPRDDQSDIDEDED